MAILIYDSRLKFFILTENDRDKILHNNSTSIFEDRDVLLSVSENKSEFIQKIFNIFNVGDIEKCEKIDSYKYVVSKDINPYLIMINTRGVIYFGKDVPVVKTKTVKTDTKYWKLWTQGRFKLRKPEEYYYLDVKEPDKLIFLYSLGFHLPPWGEILKEFNKNKWGYKDFIAKLDYPDDVFEQKLKEKKEQEERKRIEEEKQRAEIERLKHTDGYCDICGQPASYVVNPFEAEINNRVVKQWLCRDCYESLLGDI